MAFLKKLDHLLAGLEGRLIITFLWLMVVFTFIQVCLRGLYTHGHFQWANTVMGYMDWSESLVRLLVLWLTFLGASLVTREDRHIRFNLFGALLPQKWLLLRDFVLSVICLILSGVMVKICITFVRMEAEFGGTLFLGFPNWAGELIIPLGFSLILFHFLIRAMDRGLEIFRGLKR